MIVIGTLLVLGVAVMWAGPEFGTWLAAKTRLSHEFAVAWPVLRWVASAAFLVLAVELIFFWAPNVKQRFFATLPGAMIGVGFWIATSFCAGVVLSQFCSLQQDLRHAGRRHRLDGLALLQLVRHPGGC
jgi:membrane protein